MAKLKVGQKLTINGEKVVVVSLNPDGTATLNYAAGSGKSGFRGKIVNFHNVKEATSAKAVFVESIETIDEGGMSYEDYAKEETFEEEMARIDKKNEELYGIRMATPEEQEAYKNRSFFRRVADALRPSPDLPGDL